MVELRVNGETLDMTEGDFLLSFAINDISNIGQREGTASTDFDIPYTGKNARLLGYSANNNVINPSVSPYKKINADIYNNKVKISTGFIQINSFNVVDRTANITYYGGNTGFYDLAKSLQIQDIFLDDYNHIYSRVNIVNGLSYEAVNGYHYFIFDDGTRTTSGTASMNVTDFRPATFLKLIVDRGFTKLGFKPLGNFFNNPIYSRISIPCVDETIRQKSRSRKEKIAVTSYLNKVLFPFSGGVPLLPTSAYKLTQADLNIEVRGLLYDTANAQWVSDGNYTLDLEVGTGGEDWIYGAQNTNFQIRKNGVAVLSAPANLSATFARATVNVATGDYLEFYIYNPSPPSKFDIDGYYAKITLNPTIGEDRTLFLADSLPNLTFADILKWIVVSFGLIMYVDNENKNVYFIPFRDVKNNKANAVDWSDKIDMSAPINKDFSLILDDYKQNNIFAYKESSDDLQVQDINEGLEFPFGSGSFSIDNDFLDNEDTIYDAPFAPTLNIEAYKTSDTQWLWCPFIKLGGEPRILINRALNNITYYAQTYTQFSIVGNSGTSNVTSALPLYYFDKETRGAVNIDKYKESLNYSTGQIDNSTTVGMIDTYLDDYVSVLNSCELIECRMKLSSKDILNLDFTKPIYMKQFKGYYYLNKIDEYDGSTKPALVQLVKL